MNPIRSLLEWNERRLDGLGEAVEALGIPFWTLGLIAAAFVLLRSGRPMMIWASEWRKERRPIRPAQPLSDWEQLEEHEQSAAKLGWWSLTLIVILTILLFAAGA